MKIRSLLLVTLMGCGADQIGVDGAPVEGSIDAPSDEVPADAPAPAEEGGACSADECRFDTYNLDVLVGDRFVISNFLGACEGQVGVDFVFAYEDGETWNLDAFNSDRAIEITEADLSGGNHGEGEYRVFLFDSGGEELDHMTIRIGHDPESDIRPGDATPPTRTNGTCGEPDGGDADGDGGDADGDGIPDDRDPDADGDGVLDDPNGDSDGDGIPDGNDPDADGDGVLDDPNGDSDGDGVPDGQDPDADGDGILDDPNGSGTCTANEDCNSGLCVDGVCTEV
jgi:hypothetical protein